MARMYDTTMNCASQSTAACVGISAEESCPTHAAGRWCRRGGPLGRGECEITFFAEETTAKCKATGVKKVYGCETLDVVAASAADEAGGEAEEAVPSSAAAPSSEAGAATDSASAFIPRSALTTGSR